MQINVNFRHMDSTDAIREYAVKKMEKLGRYLHEPIHFEVWLHVEKAVHHAEAEVRGKGFDQKFSAEGKPDVYAALDQLEERIERSLRKHKEKVKDH